MQADTSTLVMFEDAVYKELSASEKEKYRKMDNHDHVITLLAKKIKHYAVLGIDRKMYFVFLITDTESILSDLLSGKPIPIESIQDVFAAEKIWKDYLIAMKMKRNES